MAVNCRKGAKVLISPCITDPKACYLTVKCQSGKRIAVPPLNQKSSPMAMGTGNRKKWQKMGDHQGTPDCQYSSSLKKKSSLVG
jgi:hypothetical protein